MLARRSPAAEIERQVALLAHNPVTDTLLRAVGGLVAVLNVHRQILAVNEAFLEELQVGGAEELLGLRPGEALGCVHAHDEPTGCGTAFACGACGALAAVLASRRDDAPAVRTAALQLDTPGGPRELVMRVRACPFRAGDDDFTLVFVRDVTRTHQLAALEQAFLHDFNNVLQGLQVSADLATVETDPAELRTHARHIRKLVNHLGREVDLQRSLLGDTELRLRRASEQVPLARVQADLRRVFLHHPASRDRHLVVARDHWNEWLRSDPWLLLRVLTNLVLNALEAEPPGGRVEVHCDADPQRITVRVWNRTAIPATARPHVFRRHFTTKPGKGRGLGTYAARLLTETLLEGTLEFATDDETGTEFRLTLPR